MHGNICENSLKYFSNHFKCVNTEYDTNLRERTATETLQLHLHNNLRKTDKLTLGTFGASELYTKQLL